MSSIATATDTVIPNHLEHEVCPHTGQVIIPDKQIKLFGMSLITTIIISIATISSVMAMVVGHVEDEKAKRQTLVQGCITIFCTVTYATFIIKYEKSRKQYLLRLKEQQSASS